MSDEIVIDEAWDLENSDIEIYESDWGGFPPIGNYKRARGCFLHLSLSRYASSIALC
jgi:hypothetical protein